MVLKITRAADPIKVERLNMVLYAQPGIGKSSLAFTAADPLLLDFDRGSYRAQNRKDVVQVENWNDVASITADDLSTFKTVIVDTAGRALDALSVDIIKANPKHGRGGALSLQGYGELKARFIAFLKLLNSFGKDVVLIAHMDEQRNGDEIVERLDVQGGSKGEIYKAADAMGRLVIQNGQRKLLFSPTDAAFGKNPGGFDPMDVPAMGTTEFDGFLGRVIQETKDRLNAMSEAQKAAAAEQQWFKDILPTVTDADGINGLIERAKAAGRAAVTMLHARATQLGLHGDKVSGKYIAPVESAKPEDAADPAQDDAA